MFLQVGLKVKANTFSFQTLQEIPVYTLYSESIMRLEQPLTKVLLAETQKLAA